MEHPNFDEEFENAIAEWRERHRLREDDAVLLLVELFRIHQQHWDEVRRREMPSFEHFRADIARLAEAAKVFQQQTTTLLAGLQNHSATRQIQGVSMAAAVLSAFGSLLAGYLIAKAWP
jgi:hypothetical protein